MAHSRRNRLCAAPSLVSNPKPERVGVSRENIPERKSALSIIAGFKCPEGIILCADTQEVIGPSKRSVPKLRFEPSNHPHTGEGLAVAFCGAGNNGPFIDRLVQNAWDDGQNGNTLGEVCRSIQKSIESTYKHYGKISQAGFCPSIELIYGVKMFGVCRLFSASGYIVNEVDECTAFGVGQYLAEFLASRMYDRRLNLRQCAILAAYILFQAKDHVEGCGGESHIAVLRENGVSGIANQRNINTWTEVLKLADSRIGNVLINAADIELDTKEFTERCSSLIFSINTLRNLCLDELKRDKKLLAALVGEEYGETDFFGLPLPGDSESQKAKQES